MLFSCLIDAGRLANVYTSERAHQCEADTFKKKKKGEEGKKKKEKLGARVKNFARTFATDTHTHNTTHAIYSGWRAKRRESTQLDDNVGFLLRSFNGRCASAVKAEGMHWGLVN